MHVKILVKMIVSDEETFKNRVHSVSIRVAEPTWLQLLVFWCSEAGAEKWEPKSCWNWCCKICLFRAEAEFDSRFLEPRSRRRKVLETKLRIRNPGINSKIFQIYSKANCRNRLPEFESSSNYTEF